MKTLLIFSFILCSAVHALSNSKIIYMKGDVKVEREGEEYRGHKNFQLQNSDIVRTGIDSLAIVQLENHSKLKLDDNSSLAVELNRDEKSDSKVTYINMLRGSFLMDFKKQDKEEIFIKVKKVSMGVRGTRFLVGADGEDEDHITLAVERGQVDLYQFDRDDSESVIEGHGVIVENGQNLTKPYKYNWLRNVNWNVTDSNSGSKFRGKKLKQRRLSEFRKKRKELRQRRVKRISSSVKEKRKRINQFRKDKKIRTRIKKRVKRIQKGEGRIQKRMKKRVNDLGNRKKMHKKKKINNMINKPPKPPKNNIAPPPPPPKP
jgi:hypothetical protein